MLLSVVGNMMISLSWEHASKALSMVPGCVTQPTYCLGCFPLVVFACACLISDCNTALLRSACVGMRAAAMTATSRPTTGARGFTAIQQQSLKTRGRCVAQQKLILDIFKWTFIRPVNCFFNDRAISCVRYYDLHWPQHIRSGHTEERLYNRQKNYRIGYLMWECQARMFNGVILSNVLRGIQKCLHQFLRHGLCSAQASAVASHVEAAACESVSQ